MLFLYHNDTWAIVYPLLGKEVSRRQDYLPESIILQQELAELLVIFNSKKGITNNKTKGAAFFQETQAVIGKKAVGVINPDFPELFQKRVLFSADIGAVPA